MCLDKSLIWVLALSASNLRFESKLVKHIFHSSGTFGCCCFFVCFMFYSTAMVIWRLNIGLKVSSKGLERPGIKLMMFNKTTDLPTTPQRHGRFRDIESLAFLRLCQRQPHLVHILFFETQKTILLFSDQ